MDFALTPEQEMLQDSVRRFVVESHGFERRREIVRSEHGFDPGHWSLFAELGWLGAALPEAAGGYGGTEVEAAIIIEELGRGLVGAPFLTTAILCAGLLESCPDFTGRTELLEEVVSGQALLALAYEEPQSRFDPADVETKARPDGAGSVVLDGRKIVVLDGGSADRLIVSARLFGERTDRTGICLYLVPRDAPGLALTAYRTLDNRRAADMILSGVRVPHDACLAGPEAGYDVLAAALDRAAALSAAEALGAMEAATELAAEYVKTRQQFGRPIGQFQALQHRLSDMFVANQNARSMVYRALSMLDHPPALRSKAVSATKIAVTDAATFVGQQAIQLHGGIGMTEEYPVGHFYKRLQTLGKSFGDASYHLGRYMAAMEQPARQGQQ